jgi:hypothetical protein
VLSGIEAGARILSVLALSALAGGMIFFAAVATPAVFAYLPAGVAGPFLHALFPMYYGYMIVVAVLAALGLGLAGRLVSAAVLAVVGLVTVGLLVWFLPYLDALRAAGDEAGFGRGHTASVWVDLAQLLAVLIVLGRTAV